jgi:ribosomal protein S18 acetylase RimI-like enzyme
VLQRWELTLLKKAATHVAVEVIGPFRAIPGHPGEQAGFNYALPVDPLDGTLGDAIKALQARYRQLRQPLRIEFNETMWPRLAGALEQAAFVQESRNPLMACRPAGFHPFSATSVEVRFVEPDPRFPSTRRAVGAVDGVVAGRASIGSIDGVAELYAVVTDPSFRRRGVAATVCSALVQRHFDDGGTLVFLDAENDGAVALYERLGFEHIGARLTYAEPD